MGLYFHINLTDWIFHIQGNASLLPKFHPREICMPPPLPREDFFHGGSRVGCAVLPLSLSLFLLVAKTVNSVVGRLVGLRVGLWSTQVIDSSAAFSHCRFEHAQFLFVSAM